LLQLQSAYKQLNKEQLKVAKGRGEYRKLYDQFIEFKSYLLRLYINSAKSKITVRNSQPEHGDPERESLIKSGKLKPKNHQLEVPMKDTTPVQSSILSGTFTSYCPSPPDLSHLKDLPLHVQKRYLKAQQEGSFIDR
jgi:hypothetical protein